MIAGIELAFRRLRNRLSRTSWAIGYFGLTSRQETGHAPGLLLIQIDGLSETQMQRAMDSGKLPFLKSLIEKQTYRKHIIYSGVPSTTPVVQGELLYGVKQIIPGFSYYDRACGRIFSMFEGDDAREIQRRLEEKGEPLLKGGSAYSDIFSGGAAEVNFCMTQLGWPDMFRNKPAVKFALLMLLHIPSLLRTVFLMGVELVLAVVDFCRGLIERQNFWLELKFIPSRVAICIVMREILVVRAAMDLMRGLPIVHMNFVGYDEQSHRRGPGSLFAHWTLKGIDYAIKRVYRSARCSLRRDYDVWIYSDHGQLAVKSYEAHTGRSVGDAVSEVFDRVMADSRHLKSSIQFQRTRMLRRASHPPAAITAPDRLPTLTLLSPLGSIYLDSEMSVGAREVVARALVREAGIPMVITRTAVAGEAVVWTEKGRFMLPADAGELFGREHLFLNDVVDDMVALLCHPDAGDFLISGFRLEGQSLTFPEENGSHGGFSEAETRAFALLPSDAPLPEPLPGRARRVSDIRTAAQVFLGARAVWRKRRAIAPAVARRSLRVLTYNIHSCAGMDGYVSPHRIARVIERERPDVVALQEVDIGRARSAGEDQARFIAHYLEMDHHFHAAMELKEERYGDVIMSRFPLTLMHEGRLPQPGAWLVDEPRGALWVKIDIGGGRHVQVLNTHFGIWRHERLAQVRALLGEQWLRHPHCEGPLILCGDFNSAPGSRLYNMLSEHLHDVQGLLAGHRPRCTFSGCFPLYRIDHVFVNDHFTVTGIAVPDTHLARLSSDHLPLVIDLRLQE